jgi:hypothetical protein
MLNNRLPGTTVTEKVNLQKLGPSGRFAFMLFVNFTDGLSATSIATRKGVFWVKKEKRVFQPE